MIYILNLLFWKCITLICGNIATSGGIVPINLLLSNIRKLNKEELPKYIGMVPIYKYTKNNKSIY